MQTILRRLVESHRVLVSGAALVALALAAGCAGPSSDAGQAAGPSRRASAAASDPSICPRSCFISEGQCVGLPGEVPEADPRGDQLPVVTPEPCDPRCCE